ncbi:MAG: glycosyltransferase family 39 protein, partial [Tepidisphaeraceae bacterium]
MLWIPVCVISGAALWTCFGNGRLVTPARLGVILLATAVFAVPAVSRWIYPLLERIRQSSPKARERTFIAICILATTYFIVTAILQQRDFFPKTHDEGAYLLGMQHLARFRLWYPQHPLADFFDSFYIFVKPVYCSLYFPGTAMLYVPTIWLGLPTWLMPVCVCGVIVGLVYLLACELLDGLWALVAALWMLSLSWFRMLSILVMSHPPMLMFGLLMLLTCIRFVRTGRLRWAAMAGIAAGWAFIIRPADAVVFAAPVAIGVLLRLRTCTWRHGALTVGLAIACTLPFFALQLVFDHGVTGRWLRTPYVEYVDNEQPHTSYGFYASDPDLESKSPLAQKRDYYRNVLRAYLPKHQPDRLLKTWLTEWTPMIVDSTMPGRPLLLLVPLGLLALRGRTHFFGNFIRITNRHPERTREGSGREVQSRMLHEYAQHDNCPETNSLQLARDNGRAPLRHERLWMAGLMLVVFVAVYVPNTFFLEHYAMIVAPAVIILTLAGLQATADRLPQMAPTVVCTGIAFSVGFSLNSLHELNPAVYDETFQSTMLWFVHEELPQKVHGPAVVLFRYRPGDRITEEPVYNSDVPWPDDAPVIKAHDLGARNIEIYRYYAQRQPQRMFYRFD